MTDEAFLHKTTLTLVTFDDAGQHHQHFLVQHHLKVPGTEEQRLSEAFMVDLQALELLVHELQAALEQAKRAPGTSGSPVN
jgi:hypothetical protein